MKIGGFYSDAMEIYASNDELDKAYHLASGRCLFKEGKDLAKKHRNPSKEAEFVFHQIHDLLIRNRDTRELEADFKTDLNALMKDRNPLIKAHALLLLGIANKDAGQCRSSYGIFFIHNKVAALEAFNALTEIESELKPTTVQVLDACEIANNVRHALERTSDLNQLVKQATATYGLQKVRDVYLMPPNHNSWVSVNLRSNCKVTSDKEKDDDGMIRLQLKATKDTLATHIGSFVKDWLKKYDVDTKIIGKMYTSRVHEDIKRTPYKLRGIPRNMVPSLLTEYMRSVIEYYRLGLVSNQHEMCNTAALILLQMFSPDVSLYVPVGRQQLKTAHVTKHAFMPYIHVNLEDHNHIDVWFSAWRACIIVRGNTEYVDGELERLKRDVNLQYQSTPIDLFKAPPAYKFSKRENCFYHVFNFWLYSCILIRDGKRPIIAAKIAINDFVGTIAWKRSLKMSDTNVINVLVLHTMSLFGMLTYLNHLKKTRSAKYVIPIAYTDCVGLFNLFNCQQKNGSSLYASCITEVRNAIYYKREDKLQMECYTLLNDALGLLLATNRRKNDPLEQEHVNSGILSCCFRNKENLITGTAQHCLGLALTIFANLIPFQPPFNYEETKKMFDYFFDGVLHEENMPSYLELGKNILQTSSRENLRPTLLQYYVSRLLGQGCTNGTQTMSFMMINDHGRIVYTPSPTAPKPQLNDAGPVPSSPSVESTQLQQPTSDAPGQVEQFQSDQVYQLMHGKHNILPAQGIQAPVQSPEQAVGGELSVPITEPIVSLPQPQTKWDNLPPIFDNVAAQSNSRQTVNTIQQSSVPSQVAWGSHPLSGQTTYFDQSAIQQPSYRPGTSITSQANYPQLSSTSPHYQQAVEAMHQPTHPMVTHSQPHGVLESHHIPNQPFTNQQSMMPIQQPEATSVQPWPASYQQTVTQSSYPESNYFLSNYPMTAPTGHSGVTLDYSLMQYFSDWSSYPSIFAGEYQQPGEPHIASESHSKMTPSSPGSNTAPQTQTSYSSSYFPSYTEQATQDAHHQSFQKSQHHFQQQTQMQQLPAEVTAHPLVHDEATVPVPMINTVDSRNDELSVTEDQKDDHKEGILSVNDEDVKEPVVEGEKDFWGVDEDEDAPGLSDIRKSKWPHLPTVEPHLIDPSIVTDEYCNICGVALQNKTMVDEGVGEENGAQDGIEVYDDHVRGNGHARSYIQHKNFKESFDGCYTDMVRELTELMHNCELTQAPSMTRLIDDMHEALEQYERLISKRQQHLNWRVGLTDIDNATDEFQRLLNDGKRKYEKFMSENPTLFASQPNREGDGVGGGGDSDSEFQAAISKTVEEIGEDFTLRSEKTKLEARSRKKKSKRRK